MKQKTPPTSETPPVVTSEPAKAPEPITVPPISEAPPAKVEEKSAVETVSTPPIGDVKPVVGETKPVETISAPPIGNEPHPIHEAQPISQTPPPVPQMPPPGKGSRTLNDYLKLDWTKTNADLARECGVTPQAIAQQRKKVEVARAAGKVPTFEDVTKPETPLAVQVVDYDAMAAVVFTMTTGLLTTTFGPEWQPRPAEQPGQPGEKDIVCGALSLYFKSKNAQDIPPGLMLTAVVIAYAGPRLRAPNTSSKLQMAWTWFKLKLSRFRKKP